MYHSPKKGEITYRLVVDGSGSVVMYPVRGGLAVAW
jgi:hypothetical protein